MSHLCSTVVRCWGTRAHTSPKRLPMGSGHVRCAGNSGGEPDWSISGASFRGHPDHSDVVAGGAGRSTVCVDCGLGLRGCRGNGSQFFWQRSRSGSARHDRCVRPYQSDSRLPSSRSRPGIHSRPAPPGSLVPLLVVLPFTAAAVGSAAAMSKWLRGWPVYPRSLRDCAR
jgi:hypothetical protein